MGKLLAFALGTALTYSVWLVRRSRARQRLRAIDEGTLCVACHGSELLVSDDIAHCQRCGHRVSLTALRNATLTDADIAAATKPHDAKL